MDNLNKHMDKIDELIDQLHIAKKVMEDLSETYSKSMSRALRTKIRSIKTDIVDMQRQLLEEDKNYLDSNKILSKPGRKPNKKNGFPAAAVNK